jgi:hypothetical protein
MMANSETSAGANFEDTTRELREQTERVREDLAEFSQAARRTMSGWEKVLREQLTRHPYAVLGAATGIGYVLGGGLPPLFVRALLGAAGRVALENALLSLAGKTGRS